MMVKTLSFLAALATATPLAAQAPVDSLLQRAQRSNWYLGLTTPAGRTEGRITALSRDSVRLGRARVAAFDVTRIERRTRVNGGANAGALFGAGLLGAFGHGLSGLCEGDCNEEAVLGLLGGAAVGAVLGATLGGLIDPGEVRWQTLHPMPATAAAAPPADSALGGGTFTIMPGVSFITGENTLGRAARLSLQLSHTARHIRAAETTVETYALVTPGGGVFGVALGLNALAARGSYAGAVVGTLIGGDFVFTAGLRAGRRTPGRLRLRPEARAELLYGSSVRALALTGSLAIDLR